jgi:hypothetical protein
MTANPTTHPSGATAGVVIRSAHQALGSTLAAGLPVAANAVADVLGLLDTLGGSGGVSTIPVGTVSDISAALHGRQSKRTLQRITRLLQQAGILARIWPVDAPQPQYVLEAGELRRRLGEAISSLN